MAFEKTPTVWFPGWTGNDTTVTIPIATLTELSVAEADATTGDIRSIVHALMERLWKVWTSIAAANRPTKMTVVKSASVNAVTGVLTNQYVITIQTSVITQEVVAEA